MKGGPAVGRWSGWVLTMLVLLSAGPAARLSAQCPDGSPPPCGGARAAVPNANSVAVLYFEARATDTTDLALADGISEEIINRLTGMDRLTVRSRYLVRRYRGTPVEDPAAVGRTVNATYLVTGSVRRAGGRLRVSAELVRAASGAQVWARQFDQAGDDVFAIQEAVARDVATGIVGRLLPAEASVLAARVTASAEAYDAYVLGRFYWNKRTASDLVRAAGFFQRAIRADSGFAQAWSGLADSYVLFSPQEYDVPGINPDSILTLAEAAARRAIAIAPRLGEAWASLGEILDYRDRRADAGHAFEQGVNLSPGYATAHQWYAYHLMGIGRWDEGLREMARAKELDPSSLVITTSMVLAYDGAGRWAEAEAAAEQAHALDRNHPLTIMFAEFTHDVCNRRLDRIPADFQRLALSGAWREFAMGGDTARIIDLERRLGDPTDRAGAIRALATSSPMLGLGLHLAFDADEVTLAYLEKAVGTADAAGLADYVVQGLLGPQRRADPRFRSVLSRVWGRR